MDAEPEEMREEAAIFTVRPNSGIHLEGRANHSRPHLR